METVQLLDSRRTENSSASIDLINFKAKTLQSKLNLVEREMKAEVLKDHDNRYDTCVHVFAFQVLMPPPHTQYPYINSHQKDQYTNGTTTYSVGTAGLS